MKKLINKYTIFTFIIGAIIFGAIGVLASNLLAANIGFTSDNNNWTADNVEEALNDLYTRSAYLDSMSSSDCVKGIYHHNANTHWNINIGFVPTNVSIEYLLSSSLRYNLYNKNFSDDVYYVIFNQGSATSTGKSSIVIGSIITSPTLSTSGPTYTEEYDIYYMACK